MTDSSSGLAAHGLAKAEALFKKSGLFLPAIPAELARTLSEVGEWCFSTTPLQMTPYEFYDFVADWGKAVDDRALLAHDGHGVNSYALHYYLVHGPLRLFLQLSWGGVYDNPGQNRERIRECFKLADELAAVVDHLRQAGLFPKTGTLLVVGSSHWGSSWFPPGEKPASDERDSSRPPADVLKEALEWARAITRRASEPDTPTTSEENAMDKSPFREIMEATRQIVSGRQDFETIVECCPYFEGWWRAELVAKLAGSSSSGAWKLAGFDVIAASVERGKSKTRVKKKAAKWQPDFLLATDQYRHIAWVELKLLNLCRRHEDSRPDEMRDQLRVSLDAIVGKFIRVWKYARTVDPVKTAAIFGRQKLQNLTLDQDLLKRPDEILGHADHVAVACLLATVPKRWDSDFQEKVELIRRRAKEVGDRSATSNAVFVEQWAFGTKGRKVNLVGIVGPASSKV